MDWDKDTELKFKLFISKIPVFHRRITEETVSKKAAKNAEKRGVGQIEEEDVVSAFFSDVPSSFYSMMIRLFDQTGFDYKKHTENR